MSRSLAQTVVGTVTVNFPTCVTSIPSSFTMTPTFDTPDSESGKNYLFVFFSLSPPSLKITYTCQITGNEETTCTLTSPEENLIISDSYILSHAYSEDKLNILTFESSKLTIENSPLSKEP